MLSSVSCRFNFHCSLPFTMLVMNLVPAQDTYNDALCFIFLSLCNRAEAGICGGSDSSETCLTALK
jgi:hypothetical protein